MNKNKQRIAPGPKGNLLLGSLPEIQRDALRFYLDCWRQYGDVVRFRLLGRAAWHLVSHPDDIDYVLRINGQNYRKMVTNNTLRRVVGEGLLMSEGETWLRQRRLMTPAFQGRRLENLSPIMVNAAKSLAHDEWRAYAQSGQPFDLGEEMTRLTLKIMLQTLFSANLGAQAEVLQSALMVVRQYINYKYAHVLSLPSSVPTRRNRRFLEVCETLDNIIYSIIAERRRSGLDMGDLLSTFLLTPGEEGAGMSDRQVRDEILTLIVAGHETTATALTWTWYLLAQHPECERQLLAELSQVLAGRSPTVADLPRLPYTKMVMDEAMRLYPPAWAIGRLAKGEDEIRGYHIPANSYVLILPYVTHRRADLWDDPEKFDPQRFAPQRVALLPRFAHFPFGGGPRQCIGNNFSMLESQLLLATLVPHFRLELVSGAQAEPEPSVTLRPRREVMVRLHARPRCVEAGASQTEEIVPTLTCPY